LRAIIDQLDVVVPAVLAIAAALYLWLAVRVSRATIESANNAISYLVLLIGTMIAGSAFAYKTTDPNIYGIASTLTVFSSGFVPVVLFSIYREYTTGKPHGFSIALLSVIPVISTMLAMTNELHHLIWATVDLGGSPQFVPAKNDFWMARVHAPYAYILSALAIAGLAGRLPSIARAHRRKIVLLLIGVSVPLTVSLLRIAVSPGPADMPIMSLTLVLMLPLYWWATLSLRVYEFHPLAYQTMFDHVRDPIIVLDGEQRIISVNSPAEDLLNAEESQLIGQHLWEDIPEAKAILDQCRDRDMKQTLKMASDRYYELSSAPLTGPTGVRQGSVVVCRDVTDRKRALRALHDSEHLIRSLVEHSSNGILRFARDAGDDGSESGEFHCTFANRAAEDYLQLEPTQLESGSVVGLPLQEIEALNPSRLAEYFDDVDVSSKDSDAGPDYEISIDVDGESVWLRLVAEPVGSDFSVTLVDVTERKLNETRILADSLHDPLTGVLNRRGFECRAAESISDCESGAVIYLDLNQFKSINDRFGHEAGDALLKAFGHRMGFCLRPDDILARLGGDEFAIVLPGASVADAKHVAGRLVETAFEAYIIQGQEIECSASVGIALMPHHGKDLWSLVNVADKAMYRTKNFNSDGAANDKAAYVEAAIAS